MPAASLVARRRLNFDEADQYSSGDRGESCSKRKTSCCPSEACISHFDWRPLVGIQSNIGRVDCCDRQEPSERRVRQQRKKIEMAAARLFIRQQGKGPRFSCKWMTFCSIGSDRSSGWHRRPTKTNRANSQTVRPSVSAAKAKSQKRQRKGETTRERERERDRKNQMERYRPRKKICGIQLGRHGRQRIRQRRRLSCIIKRRPA